jgi:hypothetical protein
MSAMPALRTRTRIYEPEPTLELFHACDEQVRGVAGPVGSGKSVGMCAEFFFRALEMPPSVIDNVRRFRGAAIRNTYGELKSTTIRTWEEWMPMARVVHDIPIRWRWKCPDIGDGTGVDMEVLFLALDRPDDVKKVKSLDLTMAWLNEAAELPFAVLEKARERVARYPRKEDCPHGYWSGVIMDTNMPDDDHWWYRLAEVERPSGHRFWRQPGAIMKRDGRWVFNPRAENVHNQPKGRNYWMDLLQGAREDYVKVFLAAEYGFVLDGKPVFPEYIDSTHCAPEPLLPTPGLPIWVGLDFGRTPAALIAQKLPVGRWVWLDEVCTEDMGATTFSEILKPILNGKYAGYQVAGIFGDPAGAQKSQNDEKAVFDILRAQGIPALPAPVPNNSFTMRREALAVSMRRLGLDGKPAFQISPACAVARKGLAGGYSYKRVAVSGAERFKDEPDKTRFSHIVEAGEYAMLGAGEGFALTSTSSGKPLTPHRTIKSMPSRARGRR